MNNSPVQADGEIGLLDVVVTLAESWRLLLLGPLLAGAIAFGGAAFMPKAYESEAVLGLSASELVLLRSARVLDPVLEQQGLAGASGVDAAREQLIASLKTKRIGETGQAGETGFYRVEVSQPAAPDAQALLQQIIAQLIVQSAPRGAARRTLELRLASAREALDQLIAGQEKLGVIYETAASRAAADGSVMGLGEVGRSIVELAGGIESRRGEILRAELALAGSVSEADVIQAPTLPAEPVERSRLAAAVFAAVAAGLGLVVFVFVRDGLRKSASDAAAAEKLMRIRRALWPWSKRSGRPS